MDHYGYSTGVYSFGLTATFTTLLMAPVQNSPENNSPNISINPTLIWNSVNAAVSYNLQVSTNSSFSTTFINLSGLTNYVQIIEGLTGLELNVTYYFRIAAQNSGGTKRGDILSFTTSAKLPIVLTGSATSISTTLATINGSVNPNGLSTTVWFEYGTNSSLTTSSQTTSKSIGSGTSDVSVTEGLSGLNLNTTYYYRVVAQNNAGTQKGSVVSFTTSANLPIVTTKAVSSFSSATATLQGSINPNGSASVAWFEY